MIRLALETIAVLAGICLAVAGAYAEAARRGVAVAWGWRR